MNMNSDQLRKLFIDYFKEKGHEVIPSASLIPRDDPSVLFTTAGMQQFKRFYLNPDETNFSRVTTCQKCIRTGDIDEVGDDTHLSFFEMLGNFSFGYPEKNNSYFKKEAIEYAWEFLTEKLKIEKSRIFATYYNGEKEAPEDIESLNILKSIKDLKEVKPQGFDDNFWCLGTEGSPGGPTVEFYVDGIEVWNLVFNEYVFSDGKYQPSRYKGIDTGMGLERLLTVINGNGNVYQTDLFESIIKKIEEISKKKYSQNDRAYRIISDHIKAAVFLSAENIFPSNLGQGYVMRRLIRRAIRYGRLVELKTIVPIIGAVISIYRNVYPELGGGQIIIDRIVNEESKFMQTLESGLIKARAIIKTKKPIDSNKYRKLMQYEDKRKLFRLLYRKKDTGQELERLGLTSQEILNATINGKEAFDLYQSFGFPLEMVTDLVQESNLLIDIEGFEKELKAHQELSRTASAGMFKGGLATGGEQEIKYHTTTHLLHAALRNILGNHVQQKGSNINSDRLRFDFTHPEKMTPEQITEVENLVNQKIKEDLPVTMEEMSPEDAKKSGALGFFEHKYGDKVKVYTIGLPEKYFSREICGGPHISHTGELGHFKIKKEESSSSGIRRIKAVLT